MSKHCFMLTCDDRAHETLFHLARESDASSIAEVLRSALGLYDWAREKHAQGLTVGSFKDGEPARELLLPFRVHERAEPR